MAPGPESRSPSAVGDLTEAVAALPPISLDERDSRAALQRRVDRKYLVPVERFADVVAELAADHRALEVAGTRLSGYESVYFDTPALTCFHDHVGSRAPRFKVRSRLYRESERCALEVKVKQTDGETVKHQRPHDPGDRRTLPGEGLALPRRGAAGGRGPGRPARPGAVARDRVPPRHPRRRGPVASG